MEKGTKLTEEEIQEAIILYHKVHYGADEGYALKAKAFIDRVKGVTNESA